MKKTIFVLLYLSIIVNILLLIGLCSVTDHVNLSGGQVTVKKDGSVFLNCEDKESLKLTGADLRFIVQSALKAPSPDSGFNIKSVGNINPNDSIGL